MEKLELERALMNPARLNELTEHGAYLKKVYGDHGATLGAPEQRVQALRDGSRRATRRELASNDQDFAVRSELLSDLTQFAEDVGDASPRVALRTFCEKGRKDKNAVSASRRLLMECFINRLTSAGTLSRDDEELVTKAIELLASLPALERVDDFPVCEHGEEEEVHK